MCLMCDFAIASIPKSISSTGVTDWGTERVSNILESSESSGVEESARREHALSPERRIYSNPPLWAIRIEQDCFPS